MNIWHIFIAFVLGTSSTFCMQTTQEIFLAQSVKEKVGFYEEQGSVKAVNYYLGMQGPKSKEGKLQIFDIPLRLEEILETGLRLIYHQNHYTIDDKISFLKSMTDSWSQYKNSLSRKTILRIYEGYNVDFIFKFLNYYLTFAQKHDQKYFSFQGPLDKEADNILHCLAKYPDQKAVNLCNFIATHLPKEYVVMLIKAENKEEVTPLFAAVKSYFNSSNKVDALSIVKFLLAHGANPNTTDSKGDTPLHWAATHKSLELARLLIESGADIHAYNDNEYTPLDKWPELFNIKTASK